MTSSIQKVKILRAMRIVHTLAALTLGVSVFAQPTSAPSNLLSVPLPSNPFPAPNTNVAGPRVPPASVHQAQSTTGSPGLPTFASTNLVVVKPWSEPKTPSNWPSLISVIIAAIVGVVGFQQYLLARRQTALAREKFTLDLFDKRFEVYTATMDLLLRAMSTTDRTPLIEYLRRTKQADFLFGAEIVNYVDALYQKAVDIETTRAVCEPLPPGPRRTELAQREERLHIEIADEVPKAKEVFGPYLKFKVWS